MRRAAGARAMAMMAFLAVPAAGAAAKRQGLLVGLSSVTVGLGFTWY